MGGGLSIKLGFVLLRECLATLGCLFILPITVASQVPLFRKWPYSGSSVRFAAWQVFWHVDALKLKGQERQLLGLENRFSVCHLTFLQCECLNYIMLQLCSSDSSPAEGDILSRLCAAAAAAVRCNLPVQMLVRSCSHAGRIRSPVRNC